MEKMKERIRTFFGYKDLFHELVSKDIKLKYRRSFLGYIWSILNPLLIMCIMVLVFSHMFRFDIANYPVYLIIGQTIFNFFSEATNKSMWAILGNASLLKKVYVPKYVFTLSTVTSSCVNMLFSLGAMLIVFIFCHVMITPWILLFRSFCYKCISSVWAWVCSSLPQRFSSEIFSTSGLRSSRHGCM